MIDRIVARPVVYAETFSDMGTAELFPEEWAVVSNAVPRRQSEFASGRACARQAMAQLGVTPAALLPGRGGAPQWPPGVVGSITHCSGYRAAVAAPTGRVISVGIDAEPEEPLPAGVLAAIALPAELSTIAELTRHQPGVCWDRLLFCAKEAVFKTVFPMSGHRLGFENALIMIDPRSDRFSARLLTAEPARPTGADPSGRRFLRGRWLAGDGLLIAAVVVTDKQEIAAAGR